jgi:TPR repeat protein
MSTLQDSFTNLFQGGQLESAMKKNQQQNAEVANSVTPDVITDTQSKLPKFNDFIGKIRYGTHNTVSKNGEQVVTLIRTVVTDPTQKDNALHQLLALARSNNPEAQNFIGFILANGLFGATKDQARAVEYFKASAAASYQPAIYNLALDAAYNNQNLEQATTYILRASNIGKDSSTRVCGFASFLFYRQNESKSAMRYTHECGSALAGLSVAAYDPTITYAKRVDLLRASIGTGVNDAYPLLERIAQENASNDSQFLYCKYNLLNRVRRQPQLAINDLAAQCYDKITHDPARDKTDPNRRSQAILGITSFVTSERVALDLLKSSNHFHYSWIVPYLPFQQQDVDLFAPLFPRL